MSGPIVVLPEVVNSSTSKASQITELYDQYEPLLYQFCMAMETLHAQYMQMAAPIVLDLATLAADGRCVVMDDFIESLHAHSVHLKRQAHDIMEEFQHQRRAAENLARLAR
jgi:hypothetical protein